METPRPFPPEPDPEPVDELSEDDKLEADDHEWDWDDNAYAEQVCIKRHGPL